MRIAILLVLVSSFSFAQNVAVSITPNVISLGMSTTVTITNRTAATISLPSSCVFGGVRAGTPTGPIVDGFFCLTVIVPIAPCGTQTQTWTPPSTVIGGLYYFQVDYYSSSGYTSEFFPILIQPAPNPILSASTPARIGLPLTMSINAPAAPSGAYFAAASFTTNTGFSLPGGLFVSLDIDPLFNLSFPTPNPILFTNFQGSLSPTGQASNITLNIPAFPPLLCQSLHIQAAILTAASTLSVSNPLSFTIAP